MSDGSVTVMDRLRAGLASALAGLAAGARRLEHWSARGTRPIFLGLLAFALLAVGALAIFWGGHVFGGWWHRGPHPVPVHAGPAAKPGGRPERRPDGRQEGRWEGRWEGRPEGRSEGRFGGEPAAKPEAPRPPAPPAPQAPPGPPPPPAGATQP
jgi:hypothetical protein